MGKTIVITAVVVVCAIWIGGAIFAIKTSSDLFGRGGAGSGGRRSTGVVLPKGPAPEDTLAVFPFTPSGDSDAKLYSVGFARALADRLYCAPTTVSQQPSTTSFSDALRAQKLPPYQAPSDALATKMGRSLGVRYVLTGGFRASGGQVTVSARVTDAWDSKIVKTLESSGELTDLGRLQTELASTISSELGWSLSSDQRKELAKPNFSRSDTLMLYGQSVFCGSNEQCLSLRWKAAQTDPASSFAVIRLLEYYVQASSCHDIQTDQKLATLRSNLAGRFPGNSNMALLDAILYSSECEYQSAQESLESLIRADRDNLRAHASLCGIALDRGDTQLALREGKLLVDRWPHNGYYHALLAQAYDSAANDVRRGRYFSKMSFAEERAWRSNCDDCLRESLISVELDPNCYGGWSNLLCIGQALGIDQYRDKAFQAMVRMEPNCIGPYEQYAACFAPQWGGSESDRENVFAMAAKVFGEDSPQVYLLRADTLGMFTPETVDRQAILAMAEKAVAKSGGKDLDCLLKKARILRDLERYEESLAIAEDGLKRGGTLAWRWEIGQNCVMLYQAKHDRRYLTEAERQFAKYATEMPFDVRAQIKWGWCLSHQGDRERAKQKFLRALELDPENEVAKEKMKYVQ